MQYSKILLAIVIVLSQKNYSMRRKNRLVIPVCTFDFFFISLFNIVCRNLFKKIRSIDDSWTRYSNQKQE